MDTCSEGLNLRQAVHNVHSILISSGFSIGAELGSIYSSRHGGGWEWLPVGHSRFLERGLRECQDVVEQFVFMAQVRYTAEFAGSCWMNCRKNRTPLFL